MAVLFATPFECRGLNPQLLCRELEDTLLPSLPARDYLLSASFAPTDTTGATKAAANPAPGLSQR